MKKLLQVEVKNNDEQTERYKRELQEATEELERLENEEGNCTTVRRALNLLRASFSPNISPPTRFFFSGILTYVCMPCTTLLAMDSSTLNSSAMDSSAIVVYTM